MPAIPSCTVAGRFGIERTTGTPGPIRLSIAVVGIAAATESTVCSGVGGRRLAAVALRELSRPLLVTDRDDELRRLAPATAQQAAQERLADRADAEDRDQAPLPHYVESRRLCVQKGGRGRAARPPG